MNNVSEEFRVIKYGVKETAVELRKALKVEFPGVKFSVRMARGTAYGYFDVSYTDGPPEAVVRKVTSRFQSSYFDGMDDSTKFIPPKMYMIDGEPAILEYTCDGASPSRHLSPAALAWAERVAAADPGKWASPYDHDGDTYYAARKVLAETDLRRIEYQ